jgi:glycosyl transferase family 2
VEVEQNADITVVIPAYRALDTICGAIASALTQCEGRVRVVVVIDDGCEATRNIIEDRRDERILVIRNAENLGAPASRNRGLALVATPFVSFLDADDVFEGDLLGPLVGKMRAGKADTGFGPSLLRTGKGYTRYFVPDYRSREDVFLRWFGGGEHVNTASVVWSADYLRSIGGWDEALRRNQDGELALRAILLGASFAQSSAGAGVWCNRTGSSRISARTDNLSSLLDVVARLDQLPSQFVSRAARREASAAHLYNIALRAYRIGQDEIGDEAMSRRRSLGFPDSDGSPACRAAVALRLLPRGPRTIVWRSAALVLRGLKRMTGQSDRLLDLSTVPELSGNGTVKQLT